MSGERGLCQDCAFWQFRSAQSGHTVKIPGQTGERSLARGTCHIRSPAGSEFPSRLESDWCAEFEVAEPAILPLPAPLNVESLTGDPDAADDLGLESATAALDNLEADAQVPAKSNPIAEMFGKGRKRPKSDAKPNSQA